MGQRLLCKMPTMGIALLTLFGSASPAHALPAKAVLLQPGNVILLSGTPHLWVTDDDGVLHWAGDTRALTGRQVDWSSRREVTLDELKRLRRGEPWLSAGMLKLGDPIYFVKWETVQTEPILLHIQSLADLELFGISITNYGRMVLDRSTWEVRFGIDTTHLRRDVLPAAAPLRVLDECSLMEEQYQLAKLLLTDPAQGRRSPRCSGIMTRVANAKAQDMAARNYAGHTNPEGIGPNLLLRQAGFLLPSTYGTARDANNVESWVAGSPAAKEVWRWWMDSPGHRRHLLATDPFYAEQTDYGIGYGFNSGSQYQHYWIFLSARRGS
jgi:hypothetical protein